MKSSFRAIQMKSIDLRKHIIKSLYFRISFLERQRDRERKKKSKHYHVPALITGQTRYRYIQIQTL